MLVIVFSQKDKLDINILIYSDVVCKEQTKTDNKESL